MTTFEKATIEQIEESAELPTKIREELEQGLATAVVSRTVVDGEEYVRGTILHRGPSLVERAEMQQARNERRNARHAEARSEEKDED